MTINTSPQCPQCGHFIALTRDSSGFHRCPQYGLQPRLTPYEHETTVPPIKPEPADVNPQKTTNPYTPIGDSRNGYKVTCQ